MPGARSGISREMALNLGVFDQKCNDASIHGVTVKRYSTYIESQNEQAGGVEFGRGIKASQLTPYFGPMMVNSWLAPVVYNSSSASINSSMPDRYIRALPKCTHPACFGKMDGN